jgi:hypothetical protein
MKWSLSCHLLVESRFGRIDAIIAAQIGKTSLILVG